MDKLPQTQEASTTVTKAKKTIQEQNATIKDPTNYVIGAVPAEVLSSGMRFKHTDRDYLDTVDFDSKTALPECINALEVLQMRSTSWLSGNAVDFPCLYAYRCQPRAVRHRINLMRNSDCFALFADQTGDDTRMIKNEARADIEFRKQLDQVYAVKPKLWKRIRAREFTIWPIHTSDHFVTIIIRMRHSDPHADPWTPYDEVAQFCILDPAYMTSLVSRVHRRLRQFLNRDGIRVSMDASRTPWYPLQEDLYSCGLRSYRMTKEFMERLTTIYTHHPILFQMTHKPVKLSLKRRRSLQNPVRSPASSESSTSSVATGAVRPGGSGGDYDPLRASAFEAEFQRLLWDFPFHGWLNQSRVREEMIGAAAAMALELYEYQGRVGIIPIDWTIDHDLAAHNDGNDIKKEKQEVQTTTTTTRGEEEKKDRDPDDDKKQVPDIYDPMGLKPLTGRRETKVQRYQGQGTFDPVINAHGGGGVAASASAVSSVLPLVVRGVANMTLRDDGYDNYDGNQDKWLKRDVDDFAADGASNGRYPKRFRESKQRLLKKKRSRPDRIGPAFRFRKVIGGRVIR